jgi:hypothetical protein
MLEIQDIVSERIVGLWLKELRKMNRGKLKA